MSQAPITAYLNKPLNIRLHLTAQVTLDHIFTINKITDCGNLMFRQVINTLIRTNPNVVEDLIAGRSTNPIDIG
jgi:hypothetical protein